MIYEDENAQKKKNHKSYKEYKQKLESNPNEGLILFVSAFFVMLLIFLGVVKQLSPDIDVSIGDNQEIAAEDDMDRTNVDDRLKAIQMEDNSYSTTDDTFSPELEEKVVLPVQKRKTVGEHEAEEAIALEKKEAAEKEPQKQETKAQQTTAQTQVPQPEQTAPAKPVNAKVIVGYYATSAQAEVAKSIIQDAGLNIQPFVKNIGDAYTLQVGSFSSKEKAQSVANDLLKNNFPARVIVE